MQRKKPKWYAGWSVTSEADTGAEEIVHKSIIAASKAEYCDIFGATVGGKKVKEAAAKAAIEQRLKSSCIDTFGFLEAVVSNPAAFKEFYTFATSNQIERRRVSTGSESIQTI